MKAATTTIEVHGIKINVPVGSMDKPSAASEAIMEVHQDPRGWKYPIKAFVTTDKSEADDYAYCLNWYVGGHEMKTVENRDGTFYVVSSNGYYHYVGA